MSAAELPEPPLHPIVPRSVRDTLPSLGELVARQEWMQRASCKGLTDLFFPESPAEPGRMRNGTAERRRYDRALTLCQSCPVRIECLDYATRTNERGGVWGGRIFDPNTHLRKVLRIRRPNGRVVALAVTKRKT